MKPLIYQLLPRYWGGYSGNNVRGGSLDENHCGRFSDIDDSSINYFKSLGCTHLYLTGVLRHATACRTQGCVPSHPQIVKGNAGSPYAITDYYDVNPYLADDPAERMEEFKSLIDRLHSHSLKVIIDFVPNHVSRDNVNFGAQDDRSVHWAPENDFFYYPDQALSLPGDFIPDSYFQAPYREFPARATGNNCFSPHTSITDWYETVKLNYCDFHTTTWDKMLDILQFWASAGVDGFRCDMVELVPSEFFSWVISRMKASYPGLMFIAEIYSRDLYYKYLREVGFDYLYDKSGLYDILHDIMLANRESSPCVELWQSCRRITSNWQYLGDMQNGMLNFLENHDEQRLCSDYFAGSFHRTPSALAVSLLWSGAAFMLYSGQELGERGMDSEGYSGCDGRTTIFDWWKIDSLNMLWNDIHGMETLDRARSLVLERYRELLSLSRDPVFDTGSNYDLCFCNMATPGFDPDRHFAFLRYDRNKCYLIFCNFSEYDADVDLFIPVRNCNRKVTVPSFDYRAILL